jgi:polysaccharide pyruvyl transferase CsaB
VAKILLGGYLGCGNLGDDSVMMGVIDRLGNNHDYMVMSGEPEETYRQHQIPSIPRMNPKEYERAIQLADALVLPGGSLFQDVTSVRSTLYYAGLIRSAKKHGKKVLLLNQGAGPLNSWMGKRNTAAAMNSADFVSVRDPGSVSLLKAIGVTKQIHVGADSAFLLPVPGKDVNEGEYSVGNMKSVAISPRPMKLKGIDEAHVFGELSRLLFNAGYAPTLIEMDKYEDGPMLEAITKDQGGRIPYLRNLGNPRTVQQRLARMHGIIAMRLHAGILASTVGLCPLMISYDPKVTAFAKLLDMGPALPLEGLNAARIFDAFQTHFKAQESRAALVLRKRAELAELAGKTVDLAAKLLV